MKRRILSIITALALCLSLCPTWAFAVEGEPDTGLCDHHPEHIGCGYAAPTEGHPCSHQHTAECYTLGVLPDADSGNPYEVGGDTENLLDCHHSHDSECGYVEADPGASCGYVCRICPIEDLIAALPEQVTEDNADDVRAQLDHILDLYRELDEGEQEEIDLSRIYALQGALDAANDPMPLAAGTVNNFLNFCTEYSTTISPAEGSGYKWDDATKTLTLTDFHQVVSVSFGIVLPPDSTLHLSGENTITLGSTPQVGVDCYGSLALAGDGTLAVTSGSGASPEYGAIMARGVGNRLTFDNYICKDLSYKTVKYTIQKTLYHCLSDKSEQNILSSIAPVAKVEKTDEDPFYVVSLINAFAEEYSGATITLLRDASFPRDSSISGDFMFCTDGKKVDFDTTGIYSLGIAGGTFRVNGDLISGKVLFAVKDGGTLILEQGNFSGGDTCVTLDGGALEIPDGANVSLSASVGNALLIKSGTATLQSGFFEVSNIIADVISISDACALTVDKLLAPGYCYTKNGVTQELSTMTTKGTGKGTLSVSVQKCTDHKAANSWTIMETTHCKTCVYCKTKISEEAHTYNRAC